MKLGGFKVSSNDRMVFFFLYFFCFLVFLMFWFGLPSAFAGGRERERGQQRKHYPFILSRIKRGVDVVLR